ncbi:hypothetical protein GCM10007028_12840 [Algibacter mikhailovii]|uniref:Uncharacterized protein n=1 Tax=Algibacter mikhailovii TaxID=425498 RepID=A0A918QZ94_9FLAO|nr:hypothetical protein GCM10007028_12840 [Algibacter mikhailovii]
MANPIKTINNKNIKYLKAFIVNELWDNKTKYNHFKIFINKLLHLHSY